MLLLSPTKDFDTLRTFVKGEGIIRLCSGGLDNHPSVDDIFKDPANTFLLAEKDSEKVGFICLSDFGGGGYAMHLVLRTRGQSTKDITAMAIDYAKQKLDATHIYGIYRKGARAAEALCNHFKFIPNPEKEAILSAHLGAPFAFGILTID